MNNFTFCNPTRIHFGKGQIAQIKHEIPATARVLITYGGGSIKHNGVLEQVHTALSHVHTIEFGGIEPNPHFETLMRAVALVQQEKIDYLLAVGGGSVIDGTKFIAAASCYDGDPWDILPSHGIHIQKAIPIGCVLTLAATGSEMNGNAVVTRWETKDKLGFYSDHIRPRFSILDPETTYTLPTRQTGNGVVDAFVHIVEQYMTYPVNGKVQDEYAEGLLRVLMEEGPKALSSPQDYDVRANIMWAATQALNGILSVGVPGDWATHQIGHELTALYGLDHAQTLAIVLPALWRYKASSKQAKLMQFARQVLHSKATEPDELVTEAIEGTRAFFERMGVPTRLNAYGLDAKVIPAVVAKLTEHKRTLLGERQNITPEAVTKLLELAL